MLGPHSNQSTTTCVYLDLRLGTGRAEIRYSVPGTPQNVPDKDFELLDVRVEAVAGAAPAALTTPPVIKPAYSARGMPAMAPLARGNLDWRHPLHGRPVPGRRARALR